MQIFIKLTLFHPDYGIPNYIITRSITQIDIVRRNYCEQKPDSLSSNYVDDNNALEL